MKRKYIRKEGNGRKEGKREEGEGEMDDKRGKDRKGKEEFKEARDVRIGGKDNSREEII